jgi:hypothetical protein
VRKLHEALLAGAMMETRSTTLNRVDALKAAVAEVDYAIAKLVTELKVMQGSDGARLMEAGGITEADWQRFFEQQHEKMERELLQILSDILAAQASE